MRRLNKGFPPAATRSGLSDEPKVQSDGHINYQIKCQTGEVGVISKVCELDTVQVQILHVDSDHMFFDQRECLCLRLQRSGLRVQSQVNLGTYLVIDKCNLSIGMFLAII
jgi:hypothetical protein